ncbi:MAG: RecX family transcriptional regulator [Candidatus Omnitrophica bacterium]|nr:RecX family transcriptional regulator [Candidatus Omnitrophota bacterium]
MDEYSKALRYAFLLLKYRSRSRGEIVSRLKRKSYSPAIINKVLKYLQEYNYVNDEEFARAVIACSLAKGLGIRKIAFSLKKLEVPEEIAASVLRNVVIDKEKIQEIVTKKIKYYKGKKNISAKITRHLLSRGFEYGDVIKAMQDAGLNIYDAS